MKNFILLLLLISNFSLASQSTKYYELRFSPNCILEAVTNKMRKKFDTQIPLPVLFPSSTTSFENFLVVAEKIYPAGTRIISYFNFYDVESNSIYLNNDSKSIGMNGRTADDVLAHELTHYIQHKYEKVTEEEARSDEAENAAVFIQFWFRDTYMRQENATTPCPVSQSQNKQYATGWSW